MRHAADATAPHVPVLIVPLIAAAAPIQGKIGRAHV